MSETPKIGYVASGPILSNGPQSALQLARGPIVDQNCMLAGTSYSLESKVYFVNVYARMSLNRLFSDTIYQLMWDTKKSENILIPRPRRGPTLDTKNLRPFVSKLKQNATAMNNNNESKYSGKGVYCI